VLIRKTAAAFCAVMYNVRCTASFVDLSHCKSLYLTLSTSRRRRVLRRPAAGWLCRQNFSAPLSRV